MVVVVACAVGEDEVALDFLEAKFPVLVLDEILRLVEILEEFFDAEAAHVLVRVFEVVVPLHRGVLRGRLDFGVAADECDGLSDDIHGLRAVHGDSVLGLDAEGASHDYTTALTPLARGPVCGRMGETLTTFSGS